MKVVLSDRVKAAVENNSGPRTTPLPPPNRAHQDNTTKWKALVDTGLPDTDVIPLEEALFLFALRKVQQAKDCELRAIWDRYDRHWRERLQPIAYELVRAEYRNRCTQLQQRSDSYQH